MKKKQGEIQKTLEEIEGTEKNASIIKDTKGYSRSKVSIITDYFLNLNRSFTISELKKKFPSVNDEDIRNAIYRAMKKGLIVREERGKYIVNR